MNMLSYWHSLDDNRLRAHLQCALSERQAHLASEDFGYTDEEFDAITKEARTRLFRIGTSLRRDGLRSEAIDRH
jgi:hypothetical protein